MLHLIEELTQTRNFISPIRQLRLSIDKLLNNPESANSSLGLRRDAAPKVLNDHSGTVSILGLFVHSIQLQNILEEAIGICMGCQKDITSELG